MKYLVGLALLLVFLMTLLAGCTGLRGSLLADNPLDPAEVAKVRYLKVALIGEAPEPSPELITATQSAFAGLRRKVGIDMDAYTYYQVSLDGARTMHQILGSVRAWHAPMEPATFDIGIVYTHKFLAEDVAGIVLGVVAGMPIIVLGNADISSGRFIIVRNLRLIEHEVSHLFCAMDGASGEENLQYVLQNKNRQYDSRGFGVCRNFEEAYPDTRDPHVPFGDKYLEVVERAKARARGFKSRTSQGG